MQRKGESTAILTIFWKGRWRKKCDGSESRASWASLRKAKAKQVEYSKQEEDGVSYSRKSIQGLLQVANTRPTGQIPVLHLVLYGLAPCFYLVAMPSSLPLVKE